MAEYKRSGSNLKSSLLKTPWSGAGSLVSACLAVASVGAPSLKTTSLSGSAFSGASLGCTSRGPFSLAAAFSTSLTMSRNPSESLGPITRQLALVSLKRFMSRCSRFGVFPRTHRCRAKGLGSWAVCRAPQLDPGCRAPRRRARHALGCGSRPSGEGTISGNCWSGRFAGTAVHRPPECCSEKK